MDSGTRLCLWHVLLSLGDLFHTRSAKLSRNATDIDQWGPFRVRMDIVLATMQWINAYICYKKNIGYIATHVHTST